MSIQIRVAGRVMSAIVTSAASAQTAVEWTVSEGGNGHWYARVSARTSWAQAKLLCEKSGGHLATITSSAENAFVSSLRQVGDFWLGGFQPADACEPACDWRWVTGEPWAYTNWNAGQPDDAGGIEDGLAFYPGSDRWNDRGTCANCELMPGYIIEWSSDCNNDGIIDYGQIASGQLEDDNADGVPDVCQYTVTGVIPVSGASSGGTIITVKGTNFPENPAVKVGGNYATGVVRISSTRITAITPPGLPGMTSVTVGNWVQPNAFYYRPECGSDLDQDGEVTGGDLAILLLDWGPCYSGVQASASQDPPELLADEPAQKPTNR